MANQKSKRENVIQDLIKKEQELAGIHSQRGDDYQDAEVIPDHLLDLLLKQSHNTFVLPGMDAIFSDPYPFDPDKLDLLLASFRYLKGMDMQLNKVQILEEYKRMLLEACQKGKIEQITKAFDEYVQSHAKAISQELRNFQLDLSESPYNGFLFIKMKHSAAYLLTKETIKTLMDESVLAKKKEDHFVWMLEVPIGLTVLHSLNQVPKLSYVVEGNKEMVFFERKQ